MRVARDSRDAPRSTLELRGGGEQLELDGLLALPGLINAHDHLDLALLPRLGDGRRYGNAREWADRIYRPEQSPVREHLRIPKADRLVLGGLRNLLGGVTTVCHHNPPHPVVLESSFPIRVAKDIGWAHSLDFESDVRARFDATPPDRPFVIHAAEGVDEHSRCEIAQLDALGVLSDRTILVHATACGREEWDVLRERGCGVIWCPSSNQFLFGRTLARELLESGPPIALGTDSPLTAAGDLFDELACAGARALSPRSLYEMVTQAPRRMLRLPARPDDWTLLRDGGLSPSEALLDAPKLDAVFIGGEARLLSARLARHAPRLAEGLQPLRYGDESYFVRADVTRLLSRATEVLGPDIRLGGRPIAQEPT